MQQRVLLRWYCHVASQPSHHVSLPCKQARAQQSLGLNTNLICRWIAKQPGGNVVPTGTDWWATGAADTAAVQAGARLAPDPSAAADPTPIVTQIMRRIRYTRHYNPGSRNRVIGFRPGKNYVKGRTEPNLRRLAERVLEEATQGGVDWDTMYQQRAQACACELACTSIDMSDCPGAIATAQQ